MCCLVVETGAQLSDGCKSEHTGWETNRTGSPAGFHGAAGPRLVIVRGERWKAQTIDTCGMRAWV